MTKAQTRHNRNDRPQKRIHIYIDPALHEKIGQEANDGFVSVSAWIEQACEERLERESQVQVQSARRA